MVSVNKVRIETIQHRSTLLTYELVSNDELVLLIIQDPYTIFKIKYFQKCSNFNYLQNQTTMSPKFISTLISCIFLHSSFSCKIHGTESGVCTYRYLPSTYQDGVRNELERIEIANTHWANGTKGPCENGEADHCMPFCGKYIANYYPPCVPKETRAKDRWIEEQATAIINNRIELEKQKQEKRRFYKNKACQVREMNVSKKN